MADISSSSEELIVRLSYVERKLADVIADADAARQQQKIANPAALGLFAFGLTTALLQGVFTGLSEPHTSHMVSQ